MSSLTNKHTWNRKYLQKVFWQFFCPLGPLCVGAAQGQLTETLAVAARRVLLSSRAAGFSWTEVQLELEAETHSMLRGTEALTSRIEHSAQHPASAFSRDIFQPVEVRTSTRTFQKNLDFIKRKKSKWSQQISPFLPLPYSRKRRRPALNQPTAQPTANQPTAYYLLFLVWPH